MVSSWVDELLLDDGGLIAGPHVGFLRTYAATWVRPHVLDLADVMVLAVALDIVQDYSCFSTSFALDGLAPDGRLSYEEFLGRKSCSRIAHQLSIA